MVKPMQVVRKNKNPTLLEKLKNEWDLTKRKWMLKTIGV
jgi:hypothetical protein